MNKLLFWLLSFTICMATANNFAADKPVDFEEEKKQIEKEEAEQRAERENGVKGKYQKTFLGTVRCLAESDPKLSPDVIGTFVTSNNDQKPGREYQLKVEGGSEALIEVFKKLDGKTIEVIGKLRMIGADGEAKYLIASNATQVGPTIRVPERRSANGL